MDDNLRQRREFVRFWADYVRTHDDKTWSEQQKTLINSVLRSAKQFSRKEYLERKGE